MGSVRYVITTSDEVPADARLELSLIHISEPTRPY